MLNRHRKCFYQRNFLIDCLLTRQKEEKCNYSVSKGRGVCVFVYSFMNVLLRVGTAVDSIGWFMPHLEGLPDLPVEVGVDLALAHHRHKLSKID